MAGNLQPLDQKFPIALQDGTPTQYFIRWAQQRQIDISEGITAAQAVQIIEDYLADHMIQAGNGIAISPSGNIADSPTITAEVQGILDQLSTTWGTVLFRGTADWQALAPGTAGQVLTSGGASADVSWATGSGGGGGGHDWSVIEDFTVSGAIAVHDVNVSGYDEVICWMQNVTTSVSGSRGLQVSVDSGATYYSTAGNYKYMNSGGGLTNTTQLPLHSTSSALARGGQIQLFGLRQGTTPKTGWGSDTVDGTTFIFDASNSAITNIRYLNSAGNMTAGRMITYGRVTAGATSGGGQNGWSTYTVANAGDAFINVSVNASNATAYKVIVEGVPSANAILNFRISDDNGATFKSGATDYKSGATSGTTEIVLSGTIGSGRYFPTEFTLGGMNGGMLATTSLFGLVGTHYTVASGGAGASGTYGGAANGLLAADYNAFRIFVSAGNMNGMRVHVQAVTAAAGGISSEELISELTPSGIGTVTFSSLGAYRHLRLRVTGATTSALTNDDVYVRFNGDTGANYDWALVFKSTATAAASTTGLNATGIRMTSVAGTTGVANDVGSGDMTIFNYRDTLSNKNTLSATSFRIADTTAGMFVGELSGWWSNVAAITSVTVYLLAGGNYKAGTVISLYGIR